MTARDDTTPKRPARTAPLWRRAAAVAYDLLFVIAVVILATFLALLVTGGEPVPPEGPAQWLFRLYLLAWIAAYFVFFWCRFGQTPGMKVWRLLLIRETDGACLAPMLMRFVFGLLCIATLGILFLAAQADPKRRTWFDQRLSMRVVQLLPPA
ncbi:RDD family protein [Guyparkeria hydrothermalis]|uniref:RDD family protein n=1 Tax=Guyparkeria hydrothermalis TaxID=923 RepID=UPI002020C43A|nr:RDD family protein [Guyparkeria hydrothermalis]MCL7744505.1 RDD family protein [Guyparkeria hydrothermalis]